MAIGGYPTNASLDNARHHGSAPGRTTKRPPRVTPKPRGPSIEEMARAELERFIATQMAQIEDQRRQYLADLQRVAQQSIDRGRGIASTIEQLGLEGATRAAFGDAAHDVRGLAHAFGGAIESAANADAAVQANMVSGTGQEGAVRNEGAAMGGVVSGQFGDIPGTALQTSGDAYGDDMGRQPGFARDIGGFEAGRAWESGQEGLKSFDDAIEEILRNKPEMLQDMIREQTQWEWAKQDRQYELKQRRLKAQDDKLERYYDRLDAKADAAAAKADKLENAQDQAVAMSKATGWKWVVKNGQAVPTRQAAPGWHIDPITNQPLKDGWRYDPKRGVPVKDYKPDNPKTGSSSGRGSTLTANARQDAVERVHSEDTSKAIKTYIDKQIQAGKWKPTSGTVEAFIRRVKAQFRYLAPTPTAKKQLTEVIREILEAYKPGPQRPGEGGSGSGAAGGYGGY